MEKEKIDIKDAFTKEEIKKILDTNCKSSELIEKLFKSKEKFEDKVIKKIKEQEIVINILIIVNIITVFSIFFLHKNI